MKNNKLTFLDFVFMDIYKICKGGDPPSTKLEDTEKNLNFQYSHYSI